MSQNNELRVALDKINEFEPLIETKPNTGQRVIRDFDDVIKSIDAATERANNIAFTEDDRKYIMSTRATVNTVVETINRAVVDDRRFHYDLIDSQRKELSAKADEFRATLKEALDDFDARVRAARREMLTNHFADEMFVAADVDESIKSLKFEHIEDSKWFNRSASENKTRAAINSRINAIIAVRASANIELDAEGAASLLAENDWDTGHAIIALKNVEAEQRRIEQERRDAEERRAREVEEAERRGREQAAREAEEKARREEEARREEAERRRREREEAEKPVTRRSLVINLDVVNESTDLRGREEDIVKMLKKYVGEFVNNAGDSVAVRNVEFDD